MEIQGNGPADRPVIVGIGGFTSDTGKTTLLCDLLQAFPGWEAIKTTRGHYRSCGKDPHSCCVSDLLEDKAIIKSGREETYTPGKDTGRYWDAGAANVHWVIGTDGEIADGVAQALTRVRAAGVFVEGNSFTRTIKPDLFIMVVRPDKQAIKATARRALAEASAVYLSGETTRESDEFLAGQTNLTPGAAIFSARNFNALTKNIVQIFDLHRANKIQKATSQAGLGKEPVS